MRNWIDVIEQAVPTTAMRSIRYYHGTGSTNAANSILRDGIKPGHEVQGRGHLAPVAGRTYITPSLEYALIYALGGIWMGHDMGDIGNKDPYGYVMVIDGADLEGDVQPDEDSVGEFFEKHTRKVYDETKRYSQSGPYTYEFKSDGSEDAEKRRVWRNIMSSMTPNQIRNAAEGIITAQAAGGKRALKRLSDNDKLLILQWGAHVAYQGAIRPSECWRIDKRKSKLLKSDGSNFFDIAEKVYERSEMMAD